MNEDVMQGVARGAVAGLAIGLAKNVIVALMRSRPARRIGSGRMTRGRRFSVGDVVWTTAGGATVGGTVAVLEARD